MPDARNTPHGRELSWKGFLALVVLYLAVLQASVRLLSVDVEGVMPTAEAALRNFTVPIAVTTLLGIGVVTWLGWWPQVIHDRRPPVRRWVWLVPVLMLVAALVGIDYAHLSEQDAGLLLALVVTAALIGFTEELWFRGIGVNAFRRSGFPEGRVALWTSLVFGVAHLSNAFTEGEAAIAQAVIVSTSGYLFYLCFRVAGVIWLPMVVHALWDLSLFSPQVGTINDDYVRFIVVLIVQVVLIVVVLARRHQTGAVRPAPAVETA